MRYRSRLLLATGLAAFVPLLLLGIGARYEVSRRMEADHQRRIEDGLDIVLAALRDAGDGVSARLAGVRGSAIADNDLRLALLTGDGGERRLVDYAGNAMRSAGLDLLELRDSAGLLMSSGQFRNRFGTRDPDLPRLLDSVAAPVVLLRAGLPNGVLTVVARWDTVTIAGRSLFLIGGSAVDERRLARLVPVEGADLAIGERPDPERLPPDHLVDSAAVPLIDARNGAAVEAAGVRLAVSRAPLRDVLRGLDRWLLAAVGVSAAAALLIAALVAGRMSRPIRELATEAERVDLDRLRYDFGSGRSDELGTLGDVLGDMVRRLAASAERLTDAERRAAVGDLSRQLSHDIKNGLTPIRNILRHLDQVARESPERLAEVLAERRAGLDSSLAYLEDLARRHAAPTPQLSLSPSDLRPILDEVARDHRSDGVELRLTLPQSLPVVGDPVALRRIFDNLVGNARDSVAGTAGARVVELTAAVPTPGDPGSARIVVADNGPGMTERELQRAFTDAPSTKPGGTGLGLSIVRRLVLESGGALRVETRPGSGTRVLVDLPLANDGDRS